MSDINATSRVLSEQIDTGKYSQKTEDGRSDLLDGYTRRDILTSSIPKWRLHQFWADVTEKEVLVPLERLEMLAG
jgi:hypothetical protein